MDELSALIFTHKKTAELCIAQLKLVCLARRNSVTYRRLVAEHGLNDLAVFRDIVAPEILRLLKVRFDRFSTCVFVTAREPNGEFRKELPLLFLKPHDVKLRANPVAI